jgi:N-acetylneuraminate synthase
MSQTAASVESTVHVIAELGVNHDGSVAKALELVHAAHAAGVDAVKVQTYSAANLVSVTSPKAKYQLQTTPRGETQFEMLASLELSRDDHFVVRDLAEALGLEFLSTPYDIPSLSFLVQEMGLTGIKIASSDITNLPLLHAAATLDVHVLLSTGMSTTDEIDWAVQTLGAGYSRIEPSVFIRMDATMRQDLVASARDRVALLHCTSQYPAPGDEVNMSVLPWLKDTYGTTVGYSDHTTGHVAAVMAVALGATVYERHLTLDRRSPGPDHAASLDPGEFGTTVGMIREATSAVGDGVKRPTPSEAQNRRFMRKGLFAARAIKQGQVIEASHLKAVRPCDADSVANYWHWVGTIATQDYGVDEPIGSTKDDIHDQ